MPSRWWVEIPEIDPSRVKLEFVHAAVSGWFDATEGEHAAGEKPYAVSPLADGPTGRPGLEVATFTEVAEDRLLAACGAGGSIRLGNQTRQLGRPQAIHRHTWAELAAMTRDRAWELRLETPTTFRSGDRATPLPDVRTMLSGLAREWAAWSDVPVEVPHETWSSFYVSDLDLVSQVLTLSIQKRGGQGRVEIAVPGSTGMLRIRCSDPDAAALVGPIIRFAAYAGIGSMTRRGFGVTRARGIHT